MISPPPVISKISISHYNKPYDNENHKHEQIPKIQNKIDAFYAPMGTVSIG